MSLRYEPTITAESVAAGKGNGRPCRGPATLEGRERIRARDLVPTHPRAMLMLRMEDSNFRQVSRLAILLLRIKRQECKEEFLENPARGQNVQENTAGQ